MKLKDLKISRQLNLGLGAILLLVVIIGVATWLSANNIWQSTQGIYEHPLAVRRALGEIEKDVLCMRLEIGELVDEVDKKINEHMLAIETYEASVYRHFDVVYSQYLGPKSDVENAFNLFVQWKPIREETNRLLMEGNFFDAKERMKYGGTDSIHWEKLMSALNVISTFAINKGDQFYLDAMAQKNKIEIQLLIMIVMILLFTIGVSIILLRGIKVPLKELTDATGNFSNGQLAARSRYESANEFGILSKAFNSMADSVQAGIESRENVARISQTMFEHDALRPFCHELLKTLMDQISSQVGAVYLLNEKKTHFEHYASMGLSSGTRNSFAVSRLEGEFGAALSTKQIQHIKDIPADTTFVFTTVLGDFKPKEIITIPIINGQTVIAMISLASIKNFSALDIQLIKNIWRELTARLNTILAFQQTVEYSQKLQSSNVELEVQAKELVMQADELTEQNIELEMQKKQLDEASQLKSTFLSNMSHELRTPLNSVIALASVLNRRLHNVIPEEEYSYLEVIERNGKSLLSMVNDILDLSRIEAGKEEIILSSFKIQEIVCEVVEMIEPQANEKGVTLYNLVSHDLPFINSDRTKCRHILQNIIGNAVKFTEVGTVKIAAELHENEIRIDIIDTGIGIAEKQLQYIFDEFRQADETPSKKKGGTGLGLAIAKKYAKLICGNITVQSTVHQGSTFTFTLPLKIDGFAGVDYSSLAPDLTGFSGVDITDNLYVRPINSDKYILLVEDSEPAIIQMSDILSEQRYQFKVARNGKEALEQIEAAQPDAIILDLMMPEVDGFQVLGSIRKVKKTEHIPVLILTAKHITKAELSFLKGNHIFQLIQKGSIGKSELLASMHNMLHMHNGQYTPHVNIKEQPQVPLRPVVLVVEDNADNVTTVKAILQDSYDIIEANDGQTGIELARIHNPSIILLDISLPVMDGFTVLNEIRKDETLHNTPVVALTARAMAGDREEILNYGFDGYISKPIDERLLEKVIWRLIYAD